jgi:RNA polymerase sigma-70 factor (ECF subfamily)
VLVTTPLAPDRDAAATPTWASLDAFLADIGPRAFRFAEAGLRQRDDALDAVQDAMMKMLAYRERPAGEWTPLFWSILRRRIIDLQRRARFRLTWLSLAGDDPRGEDASLDWADHAAGPAQAHEQREAYARLVEGLRALPARQREAFTLRVLEELDVATTAAAMGCSEGSVKTHLSRARQALHSYLEDVR